MAHLSLCLPLLLLLLLFHLPLPVLLSYPVQNCSGACGEVRGTHNLGTQVGINSGERNNQRSLLTNQVTMLHLLF